MAGFESASPRRAMARSGLLKQVLISSCRAVDMLRQ
jgi:hypothetical protein